MRPYQCHYILQWLTLYTVFSENKSSCKVCRRCTIIAAHASNAASCSQPLHQIKYSEREELNSVNLALPFLSCLNHKRSTTDCWVLRDHMEHSLQYTDAAATAVIFWRLEAASGTAHMKRIMPSMPECGRPEAL